MLLLNGLPVDMVHYPNNETLLRPDPNHEMEDGAPVHVKLEYTGDADIWHLFVLSQWLFDCYTTEPKFLHIPYMPYSRADRSQEGSIFTLRYFADIINQFQWDEVLIDEPHSDVTMQLIKNAVQRNTTMMLLPEVMKSIGWETLVDYIVFPDEGAQERYLGQSTIFLNQNWLAATKKRDFDTGKILDITFPDPVDPPPGTKALIVDDLCSKGGTFIGTAQKLRDMGFAKVHLLVTHMEHAGYNVNLFKAMNSIHASDTIKPPAVFEKFTIHKLEEIYEDA